MRFSEVKNDNDRFKIHSEFFKTNNLKFQNDIKKHRFSKLKNILHHNSRYGQPIYNHTHDIIILNSQHIRNDEIKYTLARKGSNKKNIEKYDILLTSTGVGTLGRVNMHYANNDMSVSIDNHITVIRSKNTNHFYLMMYLQSRYGQFQIDKHYSGTSGQIEIYPQDIGEFLIPILSNNFQLKIEYLVTTAHEKLEQSKALYAEAEHILLQELDLLDFKPSIENIAIKHLSESFGTTGRLDAEYYQPKYEEVLKIIQKTSYDILGNIVNMKKSIEPGRDAYCDKGIPFIRVANLSKDGISHSNIYLDPASMDNKKLSDLQPKKNTILFSKDGTVGIAYNIKTQTSIITSGALLHLQIKKDNILPEYLTLALNSIIVQMQSDRDVGGSIIKHWIPSEIEKITIPIIDLNIQQQIEDKIQQSFILRKESKHLLSVAKQAVELAIEENEDIALNWINEQIKSMENKL
jgi:restriction endonuclease S subunit